jgi:geranylgeranyl pyrophosphate synthase
MKPATAMADLGCELTDALAAEFEPARLAQTLGLAADQVPARVWDNALHAPLAEFLARPGKLFRARFVEIAYRLAGGEGLRPVQLALAVELLHAGSLIVDDIEDGSLVRRGGPALHRLVGVPVAINAGNWLYFWPLRLIERSGLEGLPLVRALSDTHLTLLRCHQGQALDLSVHVGNLRRSEVRGVVAATTRLKTGALLELAGRLGGRAANASEDAIDALGRFGSALGEGLQMLDDLGAVASAARLDKGEEDLRQGRPTWPWAWLAERVDDLTWMQLLGAQRELEHGAGDVAGLAAEMARLVEVHGRRVAHEHLTVAHADLAARFPEPPALLAELLSEIRRLEASYG